MWEKIVSWRVGLVFAALGVIWGLPYFFIKLAVAEVSPFFLAFCRVALAAAVLLPLAWHRGALRRLADRKAAVVAFALVEFAVPFTVISLGERWISSSVTGILIAMVPLTVALIQRFFGASEALEPWRVAGLALGFAGVAALLGTGPISYPLGWAGVGCMLLATLGYAIGPLIIQRHFADLDSIGPLAVSLSVATAVLALPAAHDWPRQTPSATALISIVVLGLVCTALAMLLMFYLVRHAGAARAAVITYINPVVATLLGVAVLHERLGVGGAIAFATILLGSWLATRGAQSRARAADVTAA
jgi:drug/metabolite transporter (DMT)-like permease